MFQKIVRETMSTVDVDKIIKQIKNGEIELDVATHLLEDGKISPDDFGKLCMACEDILLKNAACILPAEDIKRSLNEI